MSDTPESFSAVLEDLARTGRARSHPVPAASIHALGRYRRRRRRLTVATSGTLACALAAGIVATTRGSGTGGGVATPLGTPTAGSTSATSKVADDASRFLQTAELPGLKRQWQTTPLHPMPEPNLTVSLCGGTIPTGARDADTVQYKAADSSQAEASETVYHYDSEAVAKSSYSKLVPNERHCAAVSGAASAGGYGSSGADGVGTVLVSGIRDTGGRITRIEHFLVTYAGKDVAVFLYPEPMDSQTTSDWSRDDAALRAMTSRLRGEVPTPATPAPNQDSGPPPDSVWLKAEDVPFASADQSHGWYLMSSPQSGTGPSAPADLCAGNMYGIAANEHAGLTSQMWHGTPSNTPVGPGNYLYSDAYQLVYRYPDASSAQAAFTKAQGILATKSCKFADQDGTKGTRTITAGPQGSGGFSVAADDSAGLGVHGHIYVVQKGDYVAEVDIHFQAGATNTDMSKDQAFLDLLESKLP